MLYVDIQIPPAMYVTYTALLTVLLMAGIVYDQHGLLHDDLTPPVQTKYITIFIWPLKT